MKWIFKLLEKMGRKYAYVDFFGDVLFYRYYPLFVEAHEESKWFGWLPNVFIHFYPGNEQGDGFDGDHPHAHPWSTVGFLLKGSYQETINSTDIRVTKQWGFAPLSYKDFHQITHVSPGTISLFMHGVRRAKWRLFLKKCEVVCELCKSQNISCMKPDTVVNLMEYLGELNKDGWAATTYMKCDAEFERKLRLRKQAIRKLKIKTADTMPEKREALKKLVYEVYGGKIKQL